MTTLGISIGTSRLGICILQDDTLEVCRVHNFPTKWSDTKLRIILKRYRDYLHRYQVDGVIIKVPPIERYTPNLRRLIRRIEAITKEYYCVYDFINKKEIKGTYNLRSSKEIMKFVCLCYPDFVGLYEKEKKNKYGFYIRIYEAILAARIYQERLKKKALLKA